MARTKGSIRKQLATLAARKKGPTVSVYVRIKGRDDVTEEEFEENAYLISALDEDIALQYEGNGHEMVIKVNGYTMAHNVRFGELKQLLNDLQGDHESSKKDSTIKIEFDLGEPFLIGLDFEEFPDDVDEFDVVSDALLQIRFSITL